MWIKTTDGRPPRSERMTGLDQEQVDWLYEQLAQMVEREASTGPPRVLPLYTALVIVLFALRQNLAPDVLGGGVRLRVDDRGALPGRVGNTDRFGAFATV
ncbi:hypothetical protein ACWC9U_39990 [Streptomyces sp. 900116325]